jgi:hypothetical protein
MALSNKLQELVDRISRQRARLLSSISGLSDAQLNHKSEDGRWSIRELLDHVALVDEANAKLTSVMLRQARTNQPPPDPSPEGSEIHSMDAIFARMDSAKFKAPDFVEPRSQASVEESLAKMKTSRDRMLANLEQLDGLDLRGLTFPHPFAGELNAYQWVLMAGAHEARHAQQIERMKAAPGFPQ